MSGKKHGAFNAVQQLEATKQIGIMYQLKACWISHYLLMYHRLKCVKM